MQIPFRSSAGPSLGIEVELELVDVRTGHLASHATEILAELGAGHPDGEHPRAKHELFECCIEVITDVCSTVGEARADLAASIAEVREAAGRRGCTLICSGSHPFSLWGEQRVSPSERYDELVEAMQWMARRMQIFGIHIHLGVRSGEKAIALGNAMATYIPHFLALSSSSPFWEGHDTGLASTRSKIFEGLPTAGLPAELADWDDFEQYMTTLVAAGAITSVREVWWDIRPHPDFGTIELRMCDGMPTLFEVSAVAALAQSLLVHLDRLHDAGELPDRPREWILRENKWRAGRFGLGADLIVDPAGATKPATEAIAELVEQVRPEAEVLRCTEELAGIARMLEVGSSSTRQRRASDGGKNLRAVVDLLARELSTDEINR
ncbi:MAG: glutamate--cysteine ligase [Aquihabitans sp.]